MKSISAVAAICTITLSDHRRGGGDLPWTQAWERNVILHTGERFSAKRSLKWHSPRTVFLLALWWLRQHTPQVGQQLKNETQMYDLPYPVQNSTTFTQSQENSSQGLYGFKKISETVEFIKPSCKCFYFGGGSFSLISVLLIQLFGTKSCSILHEYHNHWSWTWQQSSLDHRLHLPMYVMQTSNE